MRHLVPHWILDHYARIGYEDAIAAYLALGMPVDVRLGERTALLSAVEGNKPEIIRLLVQSGADLEVRDPDDDTPLMNAAQKDALESLQTLLEQQWGIARVLIAAGADLNAADDLGWTPWRVANYLGWTPWRGRQFLAWDSWNMPEEEAPPPEKERINLVATAGLLGWMNWRKALRAARVTLDFTPDYALLVAAKTGDIEGLQAALDQGADANAVDPCGDTALTLARRQDTDEGRRCAALLLAAGAV